MFALGMNLASERFGALLACSSGRVLAPPGVIGPADPSCVVSLEQLRSAPTHTRLSGMDGDSIAAQLFVPLIIGVRCCAQRDDGNDWLVRWEAAPRAAALEE